MTKRHSGWLAQEQLGLPISKITSPNFDARPVGTVIDTVIMHCISLPPAQYGGDEVEQFFQNKLDINTHVYFEEIKQLRVSAHFYIKRNGELVQFVDMFQRAWHAGASDFFGRRRVNDFSIGIELEGMDNDVFMPVQYDSLNALLNLLCNNLASLKYIAAHSDIAPNRKTDPGEKFDWQALNTSLLNAYRKNA